MKKVQNYFQVVAEEGETSADILLYGYIGQDFWWNEERKQERITDISFVRKLRELESRYDRINIRINSPGGSVYHGDPIVSAIRNSKAEIHTYNDGMAASMAAIIWLAAPNRHMSVNAKLMLHATSSIAIGTAKAMRSEAERLDKFDSASIALFAEVTGMEEDEVRTQFYDYEDHWLTAAEAREIGFIEAAENYETKDLPEDVEQMTYTQLLELFDRQGDQEGQGMMGRLKQKWLSLFPSRQMAGSQISKPQIESRMDIKEFQDSLQKGDIKLEDVIQVLTGKGYTVEAPKTPAQIMSEQMASTVQSAVEAALKPFNEKFEKLEGKVEQLGSEPGGESTLTSIPKNKNAKLPAAQQAWLQQNAEADKAFAKAVKEGEGLKFQ